MSLNAAVPRHKAAIRRGAVSRPIRAALGDGVLRQEDRLFDYGCGHGDDIRFLRARGFAADGWDPVHRPGSNRVAADVVNLGFVLNVIEDPHERADVLRAAWGLAERLLIVAVRTTHEQRDAGRAFRDGVVTSLGTFQKYFDASEARQFIDRELGTSAVVAEPGVFYVFRNPGDRSEFTAARFRSQPPAPRLSSSEELFAAHPHVMSALGDFFVVQGRAPEGDEWAHHERCVAAFGSVARAVQVLRRCSEVSSWDHVVSVRTEELSIWLALSRFDGRPKFQELSLRLQRDIKAFFGSYALATARADALLTSLGDLSNVTAACRAAAFGKETPGAFYAHVKGLDRLPALLRLYEGCAHGYIGRVEGTTLIKFGRDAPRISYLSYPSFDRDPHPALASSVSVSLQTFRLRFEQYDHRDNPPILHRKELFVPDDYRGRKKFAAFTRREERLGLYDGAVPGTRKEWEALVSVADRGCPRSRHVGREARVEQAIGKHGEVE